MTDPIRNYIETPGEQVIKAHWCQHGKGEPVHATVRVDELREIVRSWPCCSKFGRLDRRHDPGCWAGCKGAILAVLDGAEA